MTLVLGACTGQGQSVRLEVLLPCWELCFLRRKAQEDCLPQVWAARARGCVRGAAGALSREAGSQDWPFLLPGAACGPAQLCSPCVNQREGWGQSVPLLDLDSFSPRRSGVGE